MVINRRGFLTLLASSPWAEAFAMNHKDMAYITTAAEHNDRYFIVHESLSKNSLIPITFQPHGMLKLSHERLLVVGKRPIDLMAVVNTSKLVTEQIIRLPYGRHFEGHAIADHKAGILYTSEFDFADQVSVIGRWSLPNLSAIDAFPSGGTAAHEMILDSNRLYCANGGFNTSPEFNRKLLSTEISSNLSIFDTKNNRLINTISPLEKHMSFRHLCQTSENVYAGFQNKIHQDLNNQTIVAALNKRTHELKPILTQADGKTGYITSITNFQDEWIIATSHTNHVIHLINLKSNHQTHTIAAPAPQGIQVLENRVFVTVKNGVLELTNLKKSRFRFYPAQGNWQNHCVV